MNKKRISILITAILSTFILIGTYISNDNVKTISYETLKGSVSSFGDTKILLNAYSSFAHNQIEISKDGESEVSSLNLNSDYYNAFSREFINKNKDFFKKLGYGQALINDDTLTSVGLEQKWENGVGKYYLDVKFKNGKEKTESFELEIKEIKKGNDYRILDAVNLGENILVAAYLGEYTDAGDNKGKTYLMYINTKNKSYEIISNDVLNTDGNYNIYPHELILTEKYLYMNKFDENGKKIVIKKDINSDDAPEIIYKEEKKVTNIKFENSLKSYNKKELYTITATTDGKLKLDVLDGKTGQVKSYTDLNTNKLNYNTTKDYSLSIDNCILDGNNLIISGRAQTKDNLEEYFMEIIDLNTKESTYVAKLPSNASVYEYIK